MTVKETMTRIVQSVPPETSVENAARMMKQHDIGLLPVGDKARIVGVVTDRDLVIRGMAEGRDAKHTPVVDVMTKDPYHCFEDQDIEDACFMMEEKHVRRMLVFDRQRNLVGILSLDDVATRARKDRLSGYVLSKVGKIS
jgi:CBS domain-containing protein